MKTIIFVCHGNICRSVAAEWIAKLLAIKYHLDDKYIIYSRATSTEEIGNDIYPPMKHALYRRDIPFYSHHAKQITKEDYENADYIFYMDEYNHRNLLRMFDDYKHIILPITKYTSELSIIDDPWYTGQFDEVVDELMICIENIFANLR